MPLNLVLETGPSPRPLLEHALAFVEEYYRKGHEGKTVVIGCDPEGKSTAFAAGLSRIEQQKQLAVMARYLFLKHNVKRYLVVMPAWLGEEGEHEVVAIEVRTPAGRWRLTADVLRDAEGRFHALKPGVAEPSDTPLLDHLLIHGQSLPGLMRRELDLAYRALRIATPPELCASPTP